MRIFLPILFVLTAGCGAGSKQVSAVMLEDLHGNPVTVPGSFPGKAEVYIFMRTDCPIGNRYVPEIMELSRRFAPGVSFCLVYPITSEGPEIIQEHIQEYGLDLPAYRDPRHELVKRTGATVTPEAAVFDARGRMVYRGRINDRFVEFGKARPEATKHDLKEVLETLCRDGSLEPGTTKAVGCYIEAPR